MIPPLGYSTCGRIIQFAMEDAGLLEDGAQPLEEQSAKYLQRLNDVVNFFQTQGLKLFLLQDIPVTLNVGQQQYVLGPAANSDVVMTKPLRVIQAYYLYNTLYTQTVTGHGTGIVTCASTVAGTQSYANNNPVTFSSVTTTGLIAGATYYLNNIVANTSFELALTPGGAAITVSAGTATINFNAQGVRTPLIPLSWNEWLLLSQPNNTGAVNSYFVDKQTTQLQVSLFSTPDTTAATGGQLHLLTEVQATNLITLTDSIAFPIEWFMPLRWALAADIVTGQPDSVIQRCEMKAQFYRDALESWDVEDAATMFQPDSRGQYYNNSFS